MKPKTEELLYFLLWSAEGLSRPSFQNLNDSFESWAYRHGLRRQVSRLEKQGLIERKSAEPDDRVYRLTDLGRLHALGHRDPETRWSRPWDGRWRLVLYDLPTTRNGQRNRLRLYLRRRGFGYLQNSVWISPDPMEPEVEVIRAGQIDVEALILMEASPCAGESDDEIVAGAWNFPRINRRYREHMAILAQKPSGRIDNHAKATAIRRWAAAERKAWAAAMHADPLLPQPLLPSTYLGQEAWHKRSLALGKARKELRAFAP